MPNSSEEMHLRDMAIGLQAELNESLYQREKVELTNAELCNEIQNLNDRIRMEQQVTEKLLRVIVARDSEITAIRLSHTWKIGSLVLAPLRWIKHSAL
jgi:hypothetical protein